MMKTSPCQATKSDTSGAWQSLRRLVSARCVWGAFSLKCSILLVKVQPSFEDKTFLDIAHAISCCVVALGSWPPDGGQTSRTHPISLIGNSSFHLAGAGPAFPGDPLAIPHLEGCLLLSRGPVLASCWARAEALCRMGRRG